MRALLLILAATGALLAAACQAPQDGARDQRVHGAYVSGAGGVGW